jgi:predicted DNA binding protein
VLLQLSNSQGIKIQKIENNNCNLIYELSKNQKQILDSAQKFGYYDYPRRITSEELSQKIGVDKNLTLKSLRKAEKQIISRLLKSL